MADDLSSVLDDGIIKINLQGYSRLPYLMNLNFCTYSTDRKESASSFSITPGPTVRENPRREKLLVVRNIILWFNRNSGAQLNNGI